MSGPHPESRAPWLPMALLLAGLAVFAFGMLAQTPMSPSAVMAGVIDSLQVVPSEASGAFGGGIATRAVTVYLPKAPSARVFRLPPAFASLADSLHPADTLQVLLGWRSTTDTATALRIMRNGAPLLDSAIVLGDQRRLRSRFSLAGAVLGLLGVVGLIRRWRSRT